MVFFFIMTILAIETSCDETAAAVIEARGGMARPRFDILSNVVSSQVKIHRPFGGVVPNLAKREHQKNLIPVLIQALKQSGLLKISKSKFLISKQILNSKSQILNSILEREEILKPRVFRFLKKYRRPGIDFIAVTRGPGLAPALWPGVNFARALAFFWNKPIIGINHLEGHLFSVFFQENKKKNFEFPAVALLVSGGHTQLILMKGLGKYKLIGETRDDAAGECFDKTARILGLGYPGGPAIAAAAAKIRNPESGIRNKFKIHLPRPMISSKDYDFSFSGLKTAVLYLVKEIKKSQKLLNEDIRSEIASECQQAVVDVLISKTMKAAENSRVKTVTLSGGVAANKELRRQMADAAGKKLPDSLFLIPDSRFCADNAAMIAAAAYFQHPKKSARDWRKIQADANLRLA